MNKRLQIITLKRIFKKKNPDAAADLVDWSAYVDASLNLEENIESLKANLPTFDWS